MQAFGRMSSIPRGLAWLMDHGAASILQVSRRDLSVTPTAPDPVSRTFRRIFPPRVAGLMQGMTMSKLDDMDPGDESSLRACGLSHIVAVAGLHVGSVAVLTLALFTALGVGRKCRYAAACSAAATVLAISNFRPSAVRAFLMAGLGFGGAMIGRDYDPLAGLSVAGAFILAANARALFDSGFQFSLAAALGIVLALRSRGRSSRARVFLAVCAGAQLGILPIMMLEGEGCR